MSTTPDLVWINASPSLQWIDKPLLKLLSQALTVAQWEYYQEWDEASCLETAIELLHDYLSKQNRPIHLAGHGISGVVGLLYARRYPEQVSSLNLLAVASQPAITWHSHYYVLRQLLPCCQFKVLTQIAWSLWGDQQPHCKPFLVKALRQDLDDAPCLHSLFKVIELPKGGVEVPLQVLGSTTDPVVDPVNLQTWKKYFKPGDQLWECIQGRHFFHYSQAQQVAQQILSFSYPCEASLQLEVVV
jgi:pimeloyl-ACP methyl ester carboxylesterase